MTDRAKKAETAFLSRNKAKAGKAADGGAPAVGGQRVATPAANRATAKKSAKKLQPVSPHPNAFKSQAFANSARSPVLNCGKTSPRAGLLSSPDPPPRGQKSFSTPAPAEMGLTPAPSETALTPAPAAMAEEAVDLEQLVASPVTSVQASPEVNASTPPCKPSLIALEPAVTAPTMSLDEAVENITVPDLVSFRSQLDGVVDTNSKPPRMLSMPPPNVQAAAVAVLCSLALTDGMASSVLEEDLVDAPLPPEAWMQVTEKLCTLGTYRAMLKKTVNCPPETVEVVKQAVQAVELLIAESDDEGCPLAQSLQQWLGIAVQGMSQSSEVNTLSDPADNVPPLPCLEQITTDVEPPQTPTHGGDAVLIDKHTVCEDDIHATVLSQRSSTEAAAAPTGDNDAEATVNIACLKRLSQMCADDIDDNAGHCASADVNESRRSVELCRMPRGSYGDGNIFDEERTSPFILCALTRDVMSPQPDPEGDLLPLCSPLPPLSAPRGKMSSLLPVLAGSPSVEIRLQKDEAMPINGQLAEIHVEDVPSASAEILKAGTAHPVPQMSPGDENSLPSVPLLPDASEHVTESDHFPGGEADKPKFLRASMPKNFGQETSPEPLLPSHLIVPEGENAQDAFVPSPLDLGDSPAGDVNFNSAPSPLVLSDGARLRDSWKPSPLELSTHGLSQFLSHDDGCRNSSAPSPLELSAQGAEVLGLDAKDLHGASFARMDRISSGAQSPAPMRNEAGTEEVIGLASEEACIVDSRSEEPCAGPSAAFEPASHASSEHVETEVPGSTADVDARSLQQYHAESEESPAEAAMPSVNIADFAVPSVDSEVSASPLNGSDPPISSARGAEYEVPSPLNISLSAYLPSQDIAAAAETLPLHSESQETSHDHSSEGLAHDPKPELSLQEHQEADVSQPTTSIGLEAHDESAVCLSAGIEGRHSVDAQTLPGEVESSMPSQTAAAAPDYESLQPASAPPSALGESPWSRITDEAPKSLFEKPLEEMSLLNDVNVMISQTVAPATQHEASKPDEVAAPPLQQSLRSVEPEESVAPPAFGESLWSRMPNETRHEAPQSLFEKPLEDQMKRSAMISQTAAPATQHEALKSEEVAAQPALGESLLSRMTSEAPKPLSEKPLEEMSLPDDVNVATSQTAAPATQHEASKPEEVAAPPALGESLWSRMTNEAPKRQFDKPLEETFPPEDVDVMISQTAAPATQHEALKPDEVAVPPLRQSLWSTLPDASPDSHLDNFSSLDAPTFQLSALASDFHAAGFAASFPGGTAVSDATVSDVAPGVFRSGPFERYAPASNGETQKQKKQSAANPQALPREGAFEAAVLPPESFSSLDTRGQLAFDEPLTFEQCVGGATSSLWQKEEDVVLGKDLHGRSRSVGDPHVCRGDESKQEVSTPTFESAPGYEDSLAEQNSHSRAHDDSFPESTGELASLLLPKASMTSGRKPSDECTPQVNRVLDTTTSSRYGGNVYESTCDFAALLEPTPVPNQQNHWRTFSPRKSSPVPSVPAGLGARKHSPIAARQHSPIVSVSLLRSRSPAANGRLDSAVSESTSDLAALLKPSSIRTRNQETLPIMCHQDKAFQAESTIELAALLEPPVLRNRAGNTSSAASRHASRDTSEDTLELLSLLQPRSDIQEVAEGESIDAAEVEASSSSGDASASGLASDGLAEAKIFDRCMGWGRAIPSSADQLVNASREWCQRSACDFRDAMSQPHRRSRLIQKIILAGIIIACAFLTIVELAWRLGPDAEDFY